MRKRRRAMLSNTNAKDARCVYLDETATSLLGDRYTSGVAYLHGFVSRTPRWVGVAPTLCTNRPPMCFKLSINPPSCCHLVASWCAHLAERAPPVQSLVPVSKPGPRRIFCGLLDFISEKSIRISLYIASFYKRPGGCQYSFSGPYSAGDTARQLSCAVNHPEPSRTCKSNKPTANSYVVRRCDNGWHR